MSREVIQRAAAAIGSAEAILVTAGAGMGVDSGMPDFRGAAGFWRNYPPLKALGVDFADMANPRWFDTEPQLAWGFYLHRYQLYRRLDPHDGFGILRRWCDATAHGPQVFTSNVDGHFQKSGFPSESVMEVHGSLMRTQCTACGGVRAASVQMGRHAVDMATLKAAEPLPSCTKCGSLLRPNVLMFGDGEWEGAETQRQQDRLEYSWLQGVEASLAKAVVIEVGAGVAVPTVRWFGEQMARRLDAPLIRINPRPVGGGRGVEVVEMGALAGLQALDEELQRLGQ